MNARSLVVPPEPVQDLPAACRTAAKVCQQAARQLIALAEAVEAGDTADAAYLMPSLAQSVPLACDALALAGRALDLPIAILTGRAGEGAVSRPSVPGFRHFPTEPAFGTVIDAADTDPSPPPCPGSSPTIAAPPQPDLIEACTRFRRAAALLRDALPPSSGRYSETSETLLSGGLQDARERLNRRGAK